MIESGGSGREDFQVFDEDDFLDAGLLAEREQVRPDDHVALPRDTASAPGDGHARARRRAAVAAVIGGVLGLALVLAVGNLERSARRPERAGAGSGVALAPSPAGAVRPDASSHSGTGSPSRSMQEARGNRAPRAGHDSRGIGASSVAVAGARARRAGGGEEAVSPAGFAPPAGASGSQPGVAEAAGPDGGGSASTEFGFEQ